MKSNEKKTQSEYWQILVLGLVGGSDYNIDTFGSDLSQQHSVEIPHSWYDILYSTDSLKAFILEVIQSNELTEMEKIALVAVLHWRGELTTNKACRLIYGIQLSDADFRRELSVGSGRALRNLYDVVRLVIEDLKDDLMDPNDDTLFGDACADYVVSLQRDLKNQKKGEL